MTRADLLPTDTALYLAQFSGPHTFQTFDDRPGKDRTLSRVLYDLAELADLNRRGAGVFLMVNEGDGQGRKAGNVTRIRAYCADFDGSPLPEVWPLSPCLTLETSPGKYHTYWILAEGESVPLDNTAFDRQQEAIAQAVGAQPNDCKGLSRVMRMPGYLHQKGEPVLSRLVSCTGERFTLAQIQAAYPVPIKPTRAEPSERPALPLPGDRPSTQAQTQRKYALTTLHSLADELAGTAEGGRNAALNTLAFKAGRLNGGGHLERSEVEAALSEAALQTGLPEHEVQATLSRALADGQAEPELLAQVGTATGKRKAKRPSDDAESDGEDSGNKRPPAGTRALEYALEAGAELWHDQSGNAFMTATGSGHREHYRLPSRAARDYLQTLYWGKEKRSLNGQAQGEALGLMESLARREGQEHLTAVRVAHHDGHTYLDLGSESWEVVQVGRGYWKSIKPFECPVRFTRPRGFLALPAPVQGGDLNELREFLSTDDRGFMMCVSWLLGAASGLSPYPVLALSGEQGSGKSTGGSTVKNLLDPSEADRRRAPKQEHDLFIAAQASHVLSFDNLSSIPAWLSDALCTVSTGGAFAARELYSGTEETVLKAVRPVIVNGIPDLLARPDLAERALTVMFRRPEHRQPEQILSARYERARPRLLGALLTALAEGLRNLEATQLEHPPRLADFARLIVAAEARLPWPAGAFLSAYSQMQSEAASTVLDGEPMAEALRAFIDNAQDWRGTVKGLLTALNEQEGYPDEHRPPQGWPRTPRAFGAALRRLAPALRKTGYEITAGGRSNEGERYVLRKEPDSTYTTYTTYTEPRQDSENQSVHWEVQPTRAQGNVHAAPGPVYVGAEGVHIEEANVHAENSVSDGESVHRVGSVRSSGLFSVPEVDRPTLDAASGWEEDV
ncbi:DNA-primase RepB domain-containing protein [Deinococcus sp.]|uniref:DNA-primase RepB domain-containing protein n=1 Tax=Deinococcus sp. TaxID=47478 RepID=UPI0025DC5274|nr:DNA-primase RepB domain-containing protein [Deinococcus sp.]